jgi:hypothetical protein
MRGRNSRFLELNTVAHEYVDAVRRVRVIEVDVESLKMIVETVRRF